MPLLFFDLDDTLVDRHAAFLTWARAYADELGQGPEFVTWLVEVDNGGQCSRPELWSMLCDRLGLDESTEKIHDRWRRDFPALYRLNSETEAALAKAAAAGWTLGIITNGDSDVQRAKLAAARLERFIPPARFCISKEIGVAKPDPRIFHAAAQRCGQSLDGAWMVGDNAVADIEGASRAGIRSVWISRGRQWPSTSHVVPDAVAASAEEAVAHILATAAELATRSSNSFRQDRIVHFSIG